MAAHLTQGYCGRLALKLLYKALPEDYCQPKRRIFMEDVMVRSVTALQEVPAATLASR